MLHRDLQILPSPNSGLSCEKTQLGDEKKGAACKWAVPKMGGGWGGFIRALDNSLLGRQDMM